jgi:hypothetical protein
VKWSGGSATFPAAPAACAGPPRPEQTYEDFRISAWQYAATRATGAPESDVYFGLAPVVTVEDAVAVTDERVALLGVVVAYPSDNGNHGIAMIPLARGLDAGGVRRSIQLQHLPTYDHMREPGPASKEARARLASGDVPIVAIRLAGPSTELAGLVMGNECLVYSAMAVSGTASQAPALSPIAVPE